MSHEAQGHDSHEAPVPPASTRWSEEPVAEDDALPPPFVPGRPRTAFASPPAEEPADELALEPPIEAAVEEDAPGPVDEEPFPFDAPYGGEVEPEEWAEPETAEAASGIPEDDFPFDQFDIEGQAEPSAEPEAVPSATDLGWSPADLDLEALAEEEPPESSREPTGSMGAEVVAATPEETPAAPSEAEDTTAGGDAAVEAAALLERLSEVLRREGEDGVRREMESPDRMTAILAGLLAGYVSGRS